MAGSGDNVGTLGPAGLHLIGSGGTAGAFAAIPPGWPHPRGREPGPSEPLVCLLGRDGWVRRYNPVTGGFAEIADPADYGLQPDGVAASREDVYVLDTRQRVILVMSGSATRGRSYDRPGRPRRSAACPGAPRCSAPGTATRWSTGTGRGRSPGNRNRIRPGPGDLDRIAAGSDGLVYVLEAASSVAAVIAPTRSRAADSTTRDGPSVLAAIRPPGVDADAAGALRLPGRAGRVDRSGRPSCEAPATTLTRPVLFARRPVDQHPAGQRIYRCSWHRIRVQAQLPPATSRCGSAPTARTRWPGMPRSPPSRRRTGARWARYMRVTTTCSILGSPGRYLWVRLDLAGDGYSTPSVTSLRLEYPRNSYLRSFRGVLRRSR